MRTYETVACGAFMLAERTSGHVDLLREGEHMSCFGSPDELLAKVRRYVEADEVRERIARQGHSYMVGQPNTYADRLGEILKLASAVR
jgi:spore maturation protein CgeB